MQREIKFRGKRLDNGKWIYGDLLTPKSIDDGYWIRYDDEDGDTLTHQVDPATVGQFTGLHDKNGTPIFEGDILKIGRNLTEEVKWMNVGDWIGEKQPMVGFISHGTIYKEASIKVIGTIHDTPNPSGGSDE